MTKEHPKLMAFDLDGTLAESKQPLDSGIGALLGQLLERMPVAIMSGAGFPQFEIQVLPSMPETVHLDRLYIFPANAAQCFTRKDGVWQTTYDRSFNVFERARIMQALKEALAETGLDNIPERNPDWGPQIEDRGAQITFSALGQKAPVEEKKKWDPTREKRKPLYAGLMRRLPDFSIGLNAATSIDITQKGITKAYGVRKLVEMTQISVAEMLYVGDALEEGGNDAVVIDTGIHTAQVLGPSDTAQLIEDILKN